VTPAAGAAPAAHEFESLSREFALLCDGQGVVAWCDERCRRALAIEPGAVLPALAAPGTQPKLLALFEQGASHEVRDWEVSLIVRGVPATIGFSARPQEAGIILVGHLAPQAYLRAIDQLSDSMQEVLTLNREVVAQKRELQKRHDEAVRLHRELSEAHQGVLGMHTELEDRAAQLAEAAELKSRIVANVSHEFRTPLHAIQGLTRLLLDGLDGPLTAEQSKQIGFIRASAEELTQFVDDLLDLSRAEAGKAAVRVEKFELADLVASLRGMLRPLLPRDSAVSLVFEESAAPGLETDRTKVAQIVRNLVSNALKFTLRGEVRVSCAVSAGVLEVRVADTGIGIAPEHLDRIFEEFGQVETAPPTRVKGTGLGLSLSRRLADLLGGDIQVASRPGHGSTFTLRLPAQHPEAREMKELVERIRHRAPGASSILVVEDYRKQMFVYEKYLVMAGFHVMPARTIDAARELLAETRPAAIVLDIMLEGEASWAFLGELKREPRTHDIPVLVVTVTNREQKARALGADEFWLKPIDQERLLKRLKTLTRTSRAPRVLVIDDDERSRYIVRRHLAGEAFDVSEAATGPEGVALARQLVPHVILLDFLLEDMTAFDVLDELKSDPRTRAIPVIVVTSHSFDEDQQRRLMSQTEAVISKQTLSRELAINRIRDALAKSLLVS